MEQQNKNLINHMYHLMIILSLLISRSVSSDGAQTSKHFVLVHGSGHGAWCWYKISALLKSCGHRVTALDMQGSWIDPNQSMTVRSFSGYWRPLREFMEGETDEEQVIMVGHSLGGLAISQAMEMFPRQISVAVFVTASMPGPSLNISTYNTEYLKTQGSVLDSNYTYDEGPRNSPTTLVFGPLYLSSKMYQLSPFEDFVLATALIRPLRLFTEDDMAKEIVLSTERYGSVQRVFIRSDGDELTPDEFLRWVMERNPPDEVLEIRGSDHMVMMSKPLDLLTHLQATAENYS